MVQDTRKLEFFAKFNILRKRLYIIKNIFDNYLVQFKIFNGKDFFIQTNGNHCKKYMV